ncbi:hypothetical protein E8D34_16055 [Nocardioides sp. GY 10113]|uniref:hypothetical protein n=1 Tax=Nocardioides sp. GY 10113 TaxID=2569761 RepID=UPI0010A8FDD9|nr:hypothetical protein [Nocardioides sp. GY 10113]TIC83221.1 hypothetical protein E8D34_16055 [Nocardioides sp. GY 10113]
MGSGGAADGTATGNAGIEPAPSAEPTGKPGEVVAEQERNAPEPVLARVPADGASYGRLVGSFPHQILPRVPGTQVISSSLSSEGTRVQVSLVATGAGANKVLAFYREHLGRYRFHEVPSASVPGAESAGFAWKESSVVVTAGPEAEHYTVFATLTARAA